MQIYNVMCLSLLWFRMWLSDFKSRSGGSLVWKSPSVWKYESHNIFLKKVHLVDCESVPKFSLNKTNAFINIFIIWISVAGCGLTRSKVCFFGVVVRKN